MTDQKRKGRTECMMKKRVLGKLYVSEIGIGCMGFSHGYGQIPDRETSIEAIRAAYREGCNFFDTAEAYGPNLLPENRGHNERIVGEALAMQGVPRHDYVVATKLHLPTDEARQKGVYGAIRDHLTASLKRLDMEYADLYYLHRINPEIPVEEVAEAMGRLVEEDLILAWGLSQVPVSIIDRAHRVYPLSAVQNIYSMVEHGIEDEVIPYCLAHGIGVVPFSPIASGLLSGKINADTQFEKNDDVRNWVPQLKRENIIGNQPIVDLLKEVAAQKSATPAQISLAWMLHKYPNVVPIPGSKNRERILENLGASRVVLTDQEFADLEEALSKCEVHGHRGYDESEGSRFLGRR